MSLQQIRIEDKTSTCFLKENGRFAAKLFGLHFSSVFQPIYNTIAKEPIGYEALLRVEADDIQISPAHLFNILGGIDELSLVEQLAIDLHIKNFNQIIDEEKWLFINIRSQVLGDFDRFCEFFATILEKNAINPHWLVIEIIEDKIPDEDVLIRAVRFLKELGCQVALDDFGSGSSNFERILKLAPNVIKIDRCMTEKSARDPTANFILKQLIPILHGCQCYVLIEGIETEAELFIALEANADFMQGYYFAKPDYEVSNSDGPISVYQDQPEKILQQDHCARILMDYREVFQDSVNQLKAGQDTKASFFRIARRFAVEKCYVLDELGNEIDRIKLDADSEQNIGPLSYVDETNHLRRPFFRIAMLIPSQIHISQPYLNLQKSYRCVTLSLSTRIEGKRVVICCDINLEIYCQLD